MHAGSCLCGRVRYRIAGPVKRTRHCYCSMCQKQHGATWQMAGHKDRIAVTPGTFDTPYTGTDHALLHIESGAPWDAGKHRKT